MKKLLILPILLCALTIISSSCQEDYIVEIEDKPTETIEFSGITVSRDSACMFDTIVITANAKGNNLKYRWQRGKGTIVPVIGKPNKIYFWGCHTCRGDITVSCTVENEYGAYTKDVNVFIYPWVSWQKPWPDDKFQNWLEKNKK